MNRIIIIITLILITGSAMSQHSGSQQNIPYRLTTEPAIGTKLMAMDVQVSNLLQYNVHKRFSIISHSVFSFAIPFARMEDVLQNYNYALIQKFGIGTSLYTKHTMNTFSFLAGVKYYTYSGTLDNEHLPEKITTKSTGTTSDFGLMYNLKMVRKKYFMSTRLYVPLKDGLAGMGENATIEIGAGIKLR